MKPGKGHSVFTLNSGARLLSLLLLIDGYNVLAPVAAPNRDPRWSLVAERANESSSQVGGSSDGLAEGKYMHCL